jgi:hypothetical protein
LQYISWAVVSWWWSGGCVSRTPSSSEEAAIADLNEGLRCE